MSLIFNLFDSNFDVAFPSTKSSLHIVCDSNEGKGLHHYKRIHKAVVFLKRGKQNVECNFKHEKKRKFEFINETKMLNEI